MPESSVIANSQWFPATTFFVGVLLFVTSACQASGVDRGIVVTPTSALGVMAPTAVPAATAAPEPTATLTSQTEPSRSTVATPDAPLATKPQSPTSTTASLPLTATPEPPTLPPTTLAPTVVRTSVPPPATPVPMSTPTPAPTPTPEPTPTPVTQKVYDDFGFSLRLDRGADVRPAGTPSVEQGIISFAYGDVNGILTWTPQGDGNLIAMLSGTYDLIRNNQPGLTFETLQGRDKLGFGELTVDGWSGLFLGFKAVDSSGASSGGLIGTWHCKNSQSTFTLTVTGANAALLQVRFDGLIDDFKCEP